MSGQPVRMEVAWPTRIAARIATALEGRLLSRLRRFDGIVAVVILAALAACVVRPEWITPYDPFRVDISAVLKAPSSAHWMGTDEVGRDVFARVVYGARYSLLMALIVVASATLLGLVLGGAAGFFGGRIDQAIGRLTDLVIGMPDLLFAMLIAGILGPSLANTVIAVSVVWWPSYVRLLRAEVLAAKNELYVEAARSIGASNARIIVRHLLPNSWAPLSVRATMDVGRALVVIGGLSFIGLGAQPPLPEWGTMLAGAREFILGAWWYITFPGLVILITVVSFSMFGDVLDEALRPSTR